MTEAAGREPATWPARAMWWGTVAWLAGRAALLLSATSGFKTDDAYITARYALHWANGDGLLWNRGQPPVEGYSNFTFVAIEALAIRLGIDPIDAVRAVSVASLAAVTILTYRLGRRWIGPLPSLAPVALILAYVGTYHWTMSGLETTFNEALVLGGILAALGTSPARMAAAGVLMALAGMTRPESPLVFGWLWIVAVVGWLRSRDGAARRRWLALTAGFALIYLPYFAWRWTWYGRLVPNSVACKAAWVGDRFALLSDFVPLVAWIVPFVMIALMQWRDGRLLALVGIAATYAAILVGVDPIIGGYNRHMLVAYALLAIVGVVGIDETFAVRRVSERQRALLICGVTLGFHVWATQGLPQKCRREASEYAARAEARHQIGDWINAHLSGDDWLVVGDAGVIPYVARAQVLDALCLNSAEMTSPPISFSAERFAKLVVQRKPAAIAIRSTRADHLDPPADYPVYTAILGQPDLQRDYAVAAVMGAPGDNFQYFIYLRRAGR